MRMRRREWLVEEGDPSGGPAEKGGPIRFWDSLEGDPAKVGEKAAAAAAAAASTMFISTSIG